MGATVLNDLTAYLAAQGIGTPATDLFYGILPDAPDALVALFEYPGLQSEPDMGTGNTRLVFPRIQAVARGLANDYDTPRQKMQDVVTAFTKVVNQIVGGASYKAILALQDPFLMRRDDNFRVYIACNFQVTKGYSA